MSEPQERGPNYDWKHEASHYRDECENLRELLRKVEASGERDLAALRAERDDANKKLFDLSLDLNAMRAERDQLIAEKAQANFAASHPDVMKRMYRENQRLKEALEGDNLTAKRVYRLLEERDRLRQALEYIAEYWPAHRAGHYARTALGDEGGGGRG